MEPGLNSPSPTLCDFNIPDKLSSQSRPPDILQTFILFLKTTHLLICPEDFILSPELHAIIQTSELNPIHKLRKVHQIFKIIGYPCYYGKFEIESGCSMAKVVVVVIGIVVGVVK